MGQHTLLERAPIVPRMECYRAVRLLGLARGATTSHRG